MNPRTENCPSKCKCVKCSLCGELWCWKSEEVHICNVMKVLNKINKFEVRKQNGKRIQVKV